MAVKVLPLRLDPSIDFERDLRAAYDLKPRARRQEFLRQLLQLGWAALKNGETPGTSVANLQTARPAQAGTDTSALSEGVQMAVAVRASHSSRRAPTTGHHADAQKPQSLVGFFGEARDSETA